MTIRMFFKKIDQQIANGRPAIFTDYSDGKKGYELYVPEDAEYVLSCDVKSIENAHDKEKFFDELKSDDLINMLSVDTFSNGIEANHTSDQSGSNDNSVHIINQPNLLFSGGDSLINCTSTNKNNVNAESASANSNNVSSNINSDSSNASFNSSNTLNASNDLGDITIVNSQLIDGPYRENNVVNFKLKHT